MTVYGPTPPTKVVGLFTKRGAPIKGVMQRLMNLPCELVEAVRMRLLYASNVLRNEILTRLPRVSGLQLARAARPPSHRPLVRREVCTTPPQSSI